METLPTEVEQVVAVYAAATLANQQTPARQGSVIVLSAASAGDCLVAGDLHGHRPNFEALVRLADLQAHPHRHLVLQEVCHGGPPSPTSGGCMSHRLLEAVARLKVAWPDRVHFLLSNHEMAELTDHPIMKGRKILNVLFRMGLAESFGKHAETVRRAAMQFIASCPVAVRLGDVFICHSLPEGVDRFRPDLEFLDRPLKLHDFCEQGELFHLVWGRDFRRENAQAFARLVGAKVLVHGHEPCTEGYRVPNDVQLILDCCHDRACFVLLPVNGSLDHAGVVERVARLADAQPPPPPDGSSP